MSKRPSINIDTYRLFRLILEDKRQMLIYCGVAAVVAIIVAFSIPRVYKSTVMLAPEETSNGFSGNLSSLASMVGMKVRLGSGGDAIYPEIYPDAIEGTEFLVSLFPVKVTSKDGKIKDMAYSEYIENHQKTAWWAYPIVLLKQLVKALKSDDDSGQAGKVDPFFLTKSQYDVAQAISSSIQCSVDKKTNVITITTKAQDPLIAATMANAVKEHLQRFITSYRTNKARTDQAYMEELYEKAKADYLQTQHNYSAYCDAHNDIVLQSVKTRMEDLENEMQLSYNIYSMIVEQLQMARAKVQENTPAFTILQNATVPVKHSNMPKVFILAIFLFLAVAVRTGILVKRNYKELFV